MIKEERRRKKRRKIGLYILLILILLIAAGVFTVMNVFTVENVVVEGNELYSSTQIENMVLNDEYSWNSLYVDLKYRFVDIGEVPFVDTMEVSLDNPYILKFTKKECSAIFILIPLVRMLILTKMDL